MKRKAVYRSPYWNIYVPADREPLREAVRKLANEKREVSRIVLDLIERGLETIK